MRRICFLALFFTLLSTPAYSETIVSQGAPGKKGAWPVSATVPSGSSLPVRSVDVCSSYSQSVVAVGVTAVAVPTSALSGRKLMRICNSPENVGSPKVKCLLGGTSPVMGATTAGDVLTVGDCFPYQIESTVSVKCISDTAGTAVTTFECVW